MRIQGLWRAVPAVAAPLVLVLGMPAAQGAGQSDPSVGGTGWRTFATVRESSGQTALYSMAVASPAHAWAVGGAIPSRTNAPRPVIESWNGTSWARDRLPAGLVPKLGPEPLLTTAAASPRSGLWAFTLLGGWLHGGGSTWTAGRLPGHSFLQASLTAGRAVWAFGGTSAARGAAPYAAVLTGSGGWRRTAVPGRGAVADASAVSASDIWAVLGRGLLGTSISDSGPGGLVHWDGGRWRSVAGLPALLRNSALGAVLVRSDRDVWVGGAVKNAANGTTEAVGHRNGRRWTVTRLHAPATSKHFHVVSLAPDGSGGIWALGLFVATRWPQRSAFRLWHETRGRWTGPVQPKLASKGTALLIDLAAVGRSVWAAGVIQAGISSVTGIVALRGPVP